MFSAPTPLADHMTHTITVAACRALMCMSCCAVSLAQALTSWGQSDWPSCIAGQSLTPAMITQPNPQGLILIGMAQSDLSSAVGPPELSNKPWEVVTMRWRDMEV